MHSDHSEVEKIIDFTEHRQRYCLDQSVIDPSWDEHIPLYSEVCFPFSNELIPRVRVSSENAAAAEKKEGNQEIVFLFEFYKLV